MPPKKNNNKKKKQSPKYIIEKPLNSGSETPTFNPTNKEERPSFSFQYVCTGKCCLKKCNHNQFKGVADKLRILSNLTWLQIDKERHEQHGYETLPQRIFKVSMPDVVDKKEPIMVFRYKGGVGGRIAGIRKNNVFHVLFVESKYGDLYNHGS